MSAVWCVLLPLVEEVDVVSLPWPFTDQVFREVVTAAILVIVVALAARVTLLFLDRIVMRLIGRTRTTLDDLIIKAVRTPAFILIVLLGVRAGLNQLTFLDETWVQALEGFIFVGFVFVGCVLLIRLVAEIVGWYTKNLTAEGAIDTQLVVFMRRVIQLVLLAIALIMVLDHFGLDISALVATLGVSSLAFALAAQAFLADSIAGFLIMIDRPFNVGDRIQLPQAVMGEYGDWGDVAEIGIRSTRIRSVDGVLLTVPNSKLVNDVVVNFSHSESPNLRVRVRIGVQPDLLNVQRSVEEIERIALEEPDIAREPREPEVVIREIQEYDVLVELRFYVDDARKMRRTKSRVTERILAAFEDKGIKLATPTQVVELTDQHARNRTSEQ
jgi:MscS family membrane protein